MSDLEQCWNRLQLDLILLLVNFSYELGQIMTRYDLEKCSTCSTRLQLDLISLIVNFSCELGKIITRPD